MQGFLFTQPLSGEEFLGFAREHNLSTLKAQATAAGQPSPRRNAKEPRRRRG
jgi:hypothetical protein